MKNVAIGIPMRRPHIQDRLPLIPAYLHQGSEEVTGNARSYKAGELNNRIAHEKEVGVVLDDAALAADVMKRKK
ncbi:unnamed protein product, partial [Ceratitis capitata]